MKEYAKLVGLAKSAVDNGFSRVGKSLDKGSPVDEALMLLSARAVAVGNAIVVLAQESLSNEALPLLRSLFELAAAMRWLVAEDREKRAREVLAEARASDWEMLWKTSRLKERLPLLELADGDARRALGLCVDFMCANTQGLPWGHVFEGNKETGVTSAELLRLAAIASGHVVKALDARWPGKFEGAEQLWEKAK